MAFVVEKNVPAYPGQISFFGAEAVIPEMQKLAHLRQQCRLAAVRSPGKG